jgi:hypothetical protein
MSGFYYVYSQDEAGNPEMYSDHFTAETATDQRQHYADSSGQHSLCNRRTRSEGKPRDIKRELCQVCKNKRNKQERKLRHL